MSRIISMFLTVLCLALSAPAAWAETPAKAAGGDTLLIMDKVNASKAVDKALGRKVVGTKGAEVIHEEVDSVAKLAERIIAIGCEKLVGVVAIEEKQVDDALVKLVSDSLKGCATPLIEVNILDMAALEQWGKDGFNPFKESSGLSKPALKIRGDIGLPGGGRGDFVIAAGDSGTWVESWNLKDDGGVGALFGASALGNLAPDAAPSEKGCGGGPWWWACCYSQYTICNAIRGIPFIGPLLCSNCYNSCYLTCRYGCINNPCHSCDPCGLTWLLCRFVPGASC